MVKLFESLPNAAPEKLPVLFVPFIEKPKPSVLIYQTPDELLQPEVENQVIIHFLILAGKGSKARIWHSTYLFSHQGGERVPLLHAENITMAPEWTYFFRTQIYLFTLIFKGLPSDCLTFDLIEQGPEGSGRREPGLFEFRNITRNKSDIYEILV